MRRLSGDGDRSSISSGLVDRIALMNDRILQSMADRSGL